MGVVTTRRNMGAARITAISSALKPFASSHGGKYGRCTPGEMKMATKISDMRNSKWRGLTSCSGVSGGSDIKEAGGRSRPGQTECLAGLPAPYHEADGQKTGWPNRFMSTTRPERSPGSCIRRSKVAASRCGSSSRRITSGASSTAGTKNRWFAVLCSGPASKQGGTPRTPSRPAWREAAGSAGGLAGVTSNGRVPARREISAGSRASRMLFRLLARLCRR